MSFPWTNILVKAGSCLVCTPEFFTVSRENFVFLFIKMKEFSIHRDKCLTLLLAFSAPQDLSRNKSDYYKLRWPMLLNYQQFVHLRLFFCDLSAFRVSLKKKKSTKPVLTRITDRFFDNPILIGTHQ